MKSYIQLTQKIDNTVLLIPINSFIVFEDKGNICIRVFHIENYSIVKESIEEVIQKIEDAEAEYENLSYVGTEK